MFYHRILTCLIVAVTNVLLAAAADTVSSKGIVNVYLLLDPQTAPTRLDDLARTAAKKPFNRVTLAFLRPDMYYVPDSNTLEHADIGYSSTGDFGFSDLKLAVAAIQKAGVEVFLSMGGWDYSCFPYAYLQYSIRPNKGDSYDNTIGQNDPNSCDETNNWCNACSPRSTDSNPKYAIFPEPDFSSTYQQAQTDVVNAVNASGKTLPIWHPNLYGGQKYSDENHPWDPTASTGYPTTITVTVPGDAGFHSNNRDPYEDIVYLAKDLDVIGIDLDYEEFWHADMFKAGNYSCGAAGCTLWQTTYKYAAIVKAIQCNIEAIHPSLKMSIAAAAAGAWPGPWYGGNMKGLWLNANSIMPEIFEFVTTGPNAGGINVMTYDVSLDRNECPPNTSCNLISQLDFYAGYYVAMLKNSPEGIYPGFEIGTPAYPGKTSNQAVLTTSEWQNFVGGGYGKGASSLNYNGGFIWEMFKSAKDGEMTATGVAQGLCSVYINSTRCLIEYGESCENVSECAKYPRGTIVCTPGVPANGNICQFASCSLGYVQNGTDCIVGTTLATTAAPTTTALASSTVVITTVSTVSTVISTELSSTISPTSTTYSTVIPFTSTEITTIPTTAVISTVSSFVTTTPEKSTTIVSTAVVSTLPASSTASATIITKSTTSSSSSLLGTTFNQVTSVVTTLAPATPTVTVAPKPDLNGKFTASGALALSDQDFADKVAALLRTLPSCALSCLSNNPAFNAFLTTPSSSNLDTVCQAAGSSQTSSFPSFRSCLLSNCASSSSISPDLANTVVNSLFDSCVQFSQPIPQADVAGTLVSFKWNSPSLSLMDLMSSFNTNTNFAILGRNQKRDASTFASTFNLDGCNAVPLFLKYTVCQGSVNNGQCSGTATGHAKSLTMNPNQIPGSSCYIKPTFIPLEDPDYAKAVAIDLFKDVPKCANNCDNTIPGLRDYSTVNTVDNLNSTCQAVNPTTVKDYKTCAVNSCSATVTSSNTESVLGSTASDVDKAVAFPQRLNITCIHFDQPKPIVSLRPASQTDSISLPPLVVVKVLSEGLSLFDIGWSIGENSTNFNPGTNVTLPNRRRELGDVTFTIPFPSNCEKFTLNTKYNGCVESLIGNTCPDVVTPIPHLKTDVIDPTKVAGACQQQSPVPIRSTTRGDLVIVTKESPANTAQNEPPRGVVTNLVLIIEPNVPSPTTKPSEAPIVVQTSQVPPVVVPTSQDLKLQATTTVAIQSSAVVEPPRTASTSVSATSIIVPEVVSIIPPQPSPIFASQPTSATTTSSSIQPVSPISSVEARSTVINILEVPVTTKSAARTLEVCGPLTVLLVYLLFDV